MKKALTILAIMVAAMFPQSIWADDVTWVEVSTAEDFCNTIKDNSAANVRLTADIDISALSSSKDAYIFESFTGMLTGESSTGRDHILRNSKHPLFYSLNGATISHVTLEDFIVSGATSLIARNSTNTTFSHVTVTSSSLTTNSAGDNNGMVAGYSDGCTFEYCFVDEDCIVNSTNKTVAGIVGKIANSGTISYCHNAATVTTSNEFGGGIVAFVDKGTIDHCLNTGTVKGGEFVGGIVGRIDDGTISACVNTGEVNKSDGWANYMAGMMGRSLGKVTIKDCFNFGTIGNVAVENKDNSPITADKAGTTIKNCYYYCQIEGRHEDNLYDLGTTYQKIMSGEFAKANGYYQDIDNHNFNTRYPVTLPEAGTVYSNIRCDGTSVYSNEYQSTASHEAVADGYGLCSVCGKVLDDVPSVIAVSDAATLRKVANAVNHGVDYSNTVISLTGDIDMSGEDFRVIGNYPDHPFKGTFQGNMHRIKNLHIASHCADRSTGIGVGFFGCVAGTTTIDGLIIDNTSLVTSRHNGTAAILGCISLPSSSSTDAIDFTMKNCGNEAAVSGDRNLAGLIGGVYNTDKSSSVKITLSNCYNAASIMGDPNGSYGNLGTASAFIGYVNNNVTASNCLNTGYIKGWHLHRALINRTDNATVTNTNLYNVITSAQDYKETTTLETNQVTLGDACLKLNANRGSNTDWSVWTQDLGKDSHPTFSPLRELDGALHYTCTMENDWQTICLPFDVSVDESADYFLYTLSDVHDDALIMTKVEGTLAAGTPAIIHRRESVTDSSDEPVETMVGESVETMVGESVETIDIPAASGTTVAYSPIDGSKAGDLVLTGTFTTKDVTSENGYVLADGAFWNISFIKDESKGAVYCSPFSAYLAGTANNAEKLTFGNGGYVAVDTVKGSLNDADGLNGKFLVNGRLVIIKDGKEYDASGLVVK